MRFCSSAGSLTIVLECFHLVSLFNILSRLMQENRFLQQNWLLSPTSWKKSQHKHTITTSVGSFTGWPGSVVAMLSLTRLSAVSSGISWTTQWGKSSAHILWWKHTYTQQQFSKETVNWIVSPCYSALQLLCNYVNHLCVTLLVSFSRCLSVKLETVFLWKGSYLFLALM